VQAVPPLGRGERVGEEQQQKKVVAQLLESWCRYPQQQKEKTPQREAAYWVATGPWSSWFGVS